MEQKATDGLAVGGFGVGKRDTGGGGAECGALCPLRRGLLELVLAMDERDARLILALCEQIAEKSNDRS